MNPLSINPLTGLAGLAIAAAIGFGSGWTVNGWRLNGEIKEIELGAEKAARKSEQDARTKEQEHAKRLQDAQHAATEREKKLRADADALRATAGSLRDDLAEFRRRLPSLTREAVERYADAASVVFGECTAEYQRLAEQADRIDSDRQKLEDAWPK